EVTGVSGILPPEFTRRAVEHYLANEWAVSLDDVMIRRTGWHYYEKNAASLARQVADWMGEALGWGAETRAGELRQYQAILAAHSSADNASLQQANDQPVHPLA